MNKIRFRKEFQNGRTYFLAELETEDGVFDIPDQDNITIELDASGPTVAEVRLRVFNPEFD